MDGAEWAGVWIRDCVSCYQLGTGGILTGEIIERLASRSDRIYTTWMGCTCSTWYGVSVYQFNLWMVGVNADTVFVHIQLTDRCGGWPYLAVHLQIDRSRRFSNDSINVYLGLYSRSGQLSNPSLPHAYLLRISPTSYLLLVCSVHYAGGGCYSCSLGRFSIHFCWYLYRSSGTWYVKQAK